MGTRTPWNVRGVEGEDRALIVAAARLKNMAVGDFIKEVALPAAREIVAEQLGDRDMDDLPKKPSKVRRARKTRTPKEP